MEVHEPSFRKAMDRLAKYEGKPFKQRMDAAYRTGTQLAVRPIKARAPGSLARKVTTRRGKKPSGSFVAYGAKSRRPHAGLVAAGHRIVTRGKRDTGRRTSGNPYIEAVISSHQDRIIKFISDATTDEGVSAFGSIGRF
jgi:hypothetical protein